MKDSSQTWTRREAGIHGKRGTLGHRRQTERAVQARPSSEGKHHLKEAGELRSSPACSSRHQASNATTQAHTENLRACLKNRSSGRKSAPVSRKTNRELSRLTSAAAEDGFSKHALRSSPSSRRNSDTCNTRRCGPPHGRSSDTSARLVESGQWRHSGL